MNYLIILSLLVLSSCGSIKQSAEFTQSHEYQAREEIDQSYSFTDDKPLKESEIRELLSKKVIFPSSIKMAVVRLGHAIDITTLMNFKMKEGQSLVVNDELADTIESLRKSNKRIKEVAFIPTMLMPATPTIQNLRNIAALMQADLLLIFKSRSRTDTKLMIIKENEAKSVATVEAIVLDVKSGTIPYSTVSTNWSHVKSEKGDFSNTELYLRAGMEAENKSIKEIVSHVSKFFN